MQEETPIEIEVESLPTHTEEVSEPTIVNYNGEPAIQVLAPHFETLSALQTSKESLESIISELNTELASEQARLDEINNKIALFNNNLVEPK